jgi:hypothetical protein
LVNGHPLSELTLPIFDDHATQVFGICLRDLELYFELKGVTENLKLPLASKAIRDPFTKAWLSAEYYKIGTYVQFKNKKIQKRRGKRKRGNSKGKPIVNEKGLVRTQRNSDAVAGVTRKFARPFEGPYIVSRLIPPLTVEVCDSEGRSKGIYNWKSIKVYREATDISGSEVGLIPTLG